MSLDRARSGARGVMDDQSKKRAPRIGIYDRFYPPKAHPNLIGNLRQNDTLAEPVLFLRGDYPDLLDASKEGREPRSEPDYHRLTHRVRAKERRQVAQPEGEGGGGFERYNEETCSSGFEQHAPKPCVYCYQNTMGVEIKQSHSWSWNIIHLALYHLVPRVRDNKVVQNEAGETQYYKNYCRRYNRLSQLRGQTCEACQKGHELTFGCHRWLGVGRNQQENIQNWHAEVSRTCKYCLTGIVHVGYDCAKCNSPLVDLIGSGQTQDEIDVYKNVRTTCPHANCRATDWAVPAYECGYDETLEEKVEGQGCAPEVRPEPRGLFDYVWWIQKEGEQRDTKLTYTKKKAVSKFSMRLFAGEPEEQVARISDELLQHICPQLYNFDEMLRPMDTVGQARTLGIPDPYVKKAPMVGVRPPMNAPTGGAHTQGVPGRPRLGVIPGLTR